MGSQLKCSNSQTWKQRGLLWVCLMMLSIQVVWNHRGVTLCLWCGQNPGTDRTSTLGGPLLDWRSRTIFFFNVSPAAHCLDRQQSITEVDSFRCRWACLPGCLRRCVPALVLSLCLPPWACLPPRLQSCPQAGLGCCVNCSVFFPILNCFFTLSGMLRSLS